MSKAAVNDVHRRDRDRGYRRRDRRANIAAAASEFMTGKEN
ncbi:hypothetical protein [Bradyrhizobium sp. WSM1253]|nr:hypothetical protein [Bradyrhizobium sp. WSM1253]